MHERRIGDRTVSAVGLGCMNMSMGYGAADAFESERLLEQCLDVGYTMLDTAAMYGMGHNEELIGRILAGRRHEYFLASKCGIFRNADGRTAIDGRPDVLRGTCEDSLRRLRTDVIDLYYLHRVDPAVPVEESVGALADLVTAGKVRMIGMSEASSATLRRAHAVHPIAKPAANSASPSWPFPRWRGRS